MCIPPPPSVAEWEEDQLLLQQQQQQQDKKKQPEDGQKESTEQQQQQQQQTNQKPSDEQPPQADAQVTSPNRIQIASDIPVVSEVDARNALLSMVTEHCCWGRAAARHMSIGKIVSSSAFHVRGAVQHMMIGWTCCASRVKRLLFCFPIDSMKFKHLRRNGRRRGRSCLTVEAISTDHVADQLLDHGTFRPSRPISSGVK